MDHTGVHMFWCLVIEQININKSTKKSHLKLPLRGDLEQINTHKASKEETYE